MPRGCAARTSSSQSARRLDRSGKLDEAGPGARLVLFMGLTRTEAILSLLLAGHVAALTIGAMPTLDDFGNETVPPRAASTTFQSRLTARLDALSLPAVRLHRVIYNSTRALRRPVRLYLQLTDQYAKWNMFSNPSHFNEYVRFDYTLRSGDGSRRLEREIVYPAAAPGTWRSLTAPFDSAVDKAFRNALERARTRAYRAERRDREAPLERMENDLVPFLRYFGRRIATSTGTVVERAEFWRALAPAPDPGTAWPESHFETRRRALRVPDAPSDLDWTRWAVYVPDEQ